MIIISSSPSRNGALVNDNGQLLVFSTSEPEDKTVNRRGASWTLPISTTPAGANDYFFYFENTGTKTYTMSKLELFAGAATTIYVKRVSGTPSYTASSTVSPVNKNLGFTTRMVATINEDTDITGLTDEGTIEFLRCNTANEAETLFSSSEILIPPGGQLAFQSTVATLLTATAHFSELANTSI